MTDASRARLVRQLTAHEGVRLKPYVDTVGKVTIGIGRNLTDRGISDDEAFFLLENDINASIIDLAQRYRWFIELDEVRQRVLVDMAFNMGGARLAKFKNMLAAVERGDYKAASVAMLASLWARQVKGRAIRLARWMETGSDIEYGSACDVGADVPNGGAAQ